MTNVETIEDVLRRHLTFSSVSTSGYHRLYCEVCGDGEGRLKGPRGGWRFEGEYVDYSCFNCNIKGNFDPTREIPYSREMWKIFDAFNIPRGEHQNLISRHALSQGEKSIPKQRKQKDVTPMEMPDFFYGLMSTTNSMTKKAITFLKSRRIDPESYPFFLSTGESKRGVKQEVLAKQCFNRLIIPAFKNEHLIYFQARILDEGLKTPRYISPDLPKENIIYGYDLLYKDYDKPLFVTEGFFDAHHLSGVAVLGNELNKTKIDILNRSPREKIVVPDKKLNKKFGDMGDNLAKQAIEQGWKVAFPDFGDCTDVTAAIQEYGKLYVFDSIMENICEGHHALVNLNFY